jgi:lipopolysaccharide biosynthesis glycosyltransferase
MSKNAVVWVSGKGILKPTLVSIFSFLQNNNQDNYNIIVFMDNNDDVELLKGHTDNLSWFNSNIEINLIDKYTLELVPDVGDWPWQANIRLILPHMLEKYEKVLYLDYDTVTEKNISTIFQDFLNESHNIIAGVRSKNTVVSDPTKIPHYINSGVLLIDIDKWLYHNISEKIINYLSENTPREADQTGINVVLENKIEPLPPTFNYDSRYTPIHGTAKPHIRHYRGVWKPWHKYYTKSDGEHFVKWHQASGVGEITQYRNSYFLDFAELMHKRLCDKRFFVKIYYRLKNLPHGP